MNLHHQIMNLPTNQEVETWDVTSRRLYKTGHRDARHAAAEIVLQADQCITDLEGYIAEIKSLCSNVQRGDFDSLGTIQAIQVIITRIAKR